MSYNFVTYNVAHGNSFIKSSDGHAWLRILGFFASKEAAIEHSKELANFDKGLEIRVAPLNTFRILLNSKYNDLPGSLDMETRDRETKKHAFLMDAHTKNRKDAFTETMQNAEKRKVGEIKYSSDDKLKYYQEKSLEIVEEGEGGKNVVKNNVNIKEDEIEKISNIKVLVPKSKEEFPNCKKIAMQMEVRFQRFAAIAIIKDYEHEFLSLQKINEWENKFEYYFKNLRNTKLQELLKTSEKSCKDFIMKDHLQTFIEKNPPPFFYNIWGQKMEDEQKNIWQKNDNSIDLCEKEMQMWMELFLEEKDIALWKFLGGEPPHRNLQFQEWIKNNPTPSLMGEEPAIAFLKATDTEDELKHWIKEKCPIDDADVACVSMYEWIRIKDAWNEELPRTFRHPILNKIHENKEFQKNEAKKMTLQNKIAKEITVEN
jgi:hypothetical protein